MNQSQAQTQAQTQIQAQIRRNRLLLLALWLAFYCTVTLFTPPLLDDADSVHAEVAREMLTRHDFVTLYANGIRYLEKAPLFYWLMALSMRVFGATTAASRLPLAASVAALVLVLESFARRAFASTRAGLYAGLITLSSFGIFIFTRINIPDALVCLLLTAALYAFWTTENAGALPLDSERWEGTTSTSRSTLQPSLLFATALALNVLTKGLIGIVFPLAIVALYLLLTRGPRGTLHRLTQLHPLAATALFFAVAIPWHVLIARANPGHGHPGDLTNLNGHWQVPLPTEGNVHGWAWFYFLNEQLYRYLNLRVPHDYDTAPLWLFLGLIAVWLMPWSAWLPQALAQAWPRTRHLRTLTPAQRTNLLLLLWAALPLLFFTFSTRQEYYVLPSLPPLILLIAHTLASPSSTHPQNCHPERRPSASSRAAVEGPAFSSPAELSRVPHSSQLHRDEWGVSLNPTTPLLILGTTLSTITTFFLLHTKPPAPTTDLATLLQQNPGDYALSFGHFLDLNAQALGLFRLPLALTAVALCAGPLANYLLRRMQKPHAATLSLAAASFLFLVAAHQGLRIFSPTLTSYQLADAIRPQLHAGDLLAIHGEYEAGSTLGFYLRRNDIHIVEGRSSNLWYGSFFPDAPAIFETRESIAQKWSGPQRIFLWQDPQDHDRPPFPLSPIYVLASSGGHQILSNQPNR